jgi:hypothetical protein
MSVAVRPEATPESVVLIAISTSFWVVTPANRIAPAEFSAIHPIQVAKQPERTRMALCPGIAAGMPSLENFP